ncbi:BglII/BstYI family type II restriction endonuclease [Winogradskyella ouciana]|uniref:Restriction endonuclease n=1 Tax=Winogradskyella ouciana TaxID=2608631 RepID=A0A7K1GGP9_9FLAO|nr:BglII/BstYI family type II restriction endonuclease [Winogradskyella ouciana]MTE27019.1 restriction endonuclease [Winogradskyella ouciana]
MKIEEYCHNCEAQNIPPNLKDGIYEVIENLNFEFYKGCSKKLREILKDNLMKLGWSEKVELDANTRINITSMNKGFGLCLQTGNMSRFYADLLKLEYLYKKGKLNGAFYILPSKEAANKLGSNIVNFNRFTHELDVFKKVITIPINVIGLK